MMKLGTFYDFEYVNKNPVSCTEVTTVADAVSAVKKAVLLSITGAYPEGARKFFVFNYE
jgi:hypothetical protein